MKQLSPKKSRSVSHSRGGQAKKLATKQLSSSSLLTKGTCSTKSRSRSPSPQRVRGMDPGGLIVIPRRKSAVPQKQSTKADVVVASSSDKEVKWKESSSAKKQKKQETAHVVAPAVSVLTIANGKKSSSDKHEKSGNASSQVKETALVVYNEKSAAASTAVSNGRAETEEAATTNAGRKNRAHFWSPKGTQRQRSVSRKTSRNENVGGNGGNSDENKGNRKNASFKLTRSRSLSRSRLSRGNLKESDHGGEEDKTNKNSGETKEKNEKKLAASSSDKQPTVAKKELSKQKSAKLSSISGSREAIRSFSRKNGQKSNWQGDNSDGEDGKNKSWKDSIVPPSPAGEKGAYIERLDAATPVKKKSFIKRLGSKFSGRSSAVADSIDDNEVAGASEVSLNTIAAAAAAPATKNQISSRERARGGGSQLQQRAVSKRGIRSHSLSPQDMRRRRPSLSPHRSESSRSFSDRESFYSGSRSPSTSPRRNRRSLSPHSTRLRSYSGSRSPSPRRRRSMSSESRSSQRSYTSVSVSFYSESARTPSPPRRRLTTSVSPSPRFNPRRVRRFHSRSRTPSPQNMREAGGARRRRRSPPRVNQNRRDSFHSLSPPMRRKPNGPPMRRQTSFNAMPRRFSSLSRSQSPEPPRGLRQMSAHGNRQQNIGNPGPNRQMTSRRGMYTGHNRRGSNSPPLKRSFAHYERDRPHNSDFDPRRKVAPNTTRQKTFQRRGSLEGRRSTFQRRGSLESRTIRSPSPVRVPPQLQQRQIPDVYKRPVSRSFVSAPAVESQALVVRDPLTSTPAPVSRVEYQPLQNVQASRRNSLASESTGVWIDCPQNDPCDEELTFSECQGLRNDDSSDATYGATNGLSPGSPSVTHSFATYKISDGPPSRKFTKSGRLYGNNHTRSKAADLARMAIAEIQNKTELTGGDREDANVRNDIARKLSGGSIPSRDKKQSSPFVPGPPPRKPPMNMMSLSSGTEPLRPKPSEFVRPNSLPNIKAVAAIHQEAQDDEPPSINQPSPPPPPFLPRPNDSSVERNQTETLNLSFQGPFEVQNNWPQYLPTGKRNTSKSRESSRTSSPEREISRGRQASSIGRGASNETSDGRALYSRVPGNLNGNNRQVDEGDNIDISKVALSLQQIASQTPPPLNGSDVFDMAKRATPSPSQQINSKPLQHNYQHQMHGPPMHHIPLYEQQQVNYDHQSHAPELHHPPNLKHQSPPANKDTEWTKYAVKCSARENEDASKKKERRKSKISGKVPDKLSNHESRTHLAVKDMPFTDTFGDAGIYTGQVNDNGRPDGKGSMKYNNGIFYEGTWTDGSQDEKAVTQYDRIRSGFTSWGGKGKVAVKSGQTLPWNAHRKDKHDENDKMNVRGMEWVDLNGDAGRYTGEVNKDNTPHGKGIMKFDFGLIAEGEWVHGVLKENPHDRALSAAELNARGQGADAVSVMSSVRSLGRGGGMSVGPVVSGSIAQLRPPMLSGGMSVGPGISVGQGSFYGGIPQPQMMMQPQPQMMMQPQQMMMVQPQLPPPMMMPQPNNLAMQNAALVAQQNAMMKAIHGHGGGFPPMALMPPSRQQQNSQADPPISEIKFS